MVEASRRFVCIRPATYESAEEAPVLEALFRTGSGELENTTFAILAPDGKTRLSRTGRTPDHVFDDAESMARFMDRTADEFQGTSRGAPLPTVPDLRLGLDVASCDQRPLVVVAAPHGRLRTMVSRLEELAWSDEFVGRFRYVVQEGSDGLDSIDAFGETGYFVVEASEFGLDGEVLVAMPSTASGEAIAEGLTEALDLFGTPASKNYREHMRRGHQLGIEWETAIPVTDPHGAEGPGGPDGPPGPPPRR